MDILLEHKDGVAELVFHGHSVTSLMQGLVGAFDRGKGLVKHLDIAEHYGVDEALRKGDFPHEVLAPGCYLFDANGAVTFLANVHVRRGELTLFADFPADEQARQALLGPAEMYPAAFRRHGGVFYFVTPKEDLVSVACTDPRVERRVFAEAVKAATFGRPHPEPLEGQEVLHEVLSPLAEAGALHVRRRRGDYPGEKHAAALGHATIWVRGLVRRKLRDRKIEYRHPAEVSQHEIVAVPNARNISVSPGRTVPLREFYGLNRWLFDRFGPVYFFALLAAFLTALCPALSMLTEGPTPAGLLGLGLLLAASYGLGDVAARE